MRFLFDIIHPSDVNFFKNSINVLKKDNNIEIILRYRGKTFEIFRRELSDIHCTVIGRHNKALAGKILSVSGRFVYLLLFQHNKNFDASASFGSFHLNLTSKLNGIPSALFGDDYEYMGKFGRILHEYSGAKYRVIPASIPIIGNNVLKYNGFKELAYLHPNYFKADKRCLDQYDLEPNNYVFIREIDKNSLNYMNLKQLNLVKIIDTINDLGFKVVLSLENKTRANILKDKCIILEEPVDDIYSLLYFASFTISSGDSMARESCLVGTPTIYTGGRDMIINKDLIIKSVMFKVDKEQQLDMFIKYLINNNIKKETQNTIAKAIENEWTDTTQVILDVMKSLSTNNDSFVEKYKYSEF